MYILYNDKRAPEIFRCRLYVYVKADTSYNGGDRTAGDSLPESIESHKYLSCTSSFLSPSLFLLRIGITVSHTFLVTREYQLWQTSRDSKGKRVDRSL